MSHPKELNRLNAEIASHFGHLNKCLIYVLSLYVYGVVMVRHCGQTQVVTFLSGLLNYRYYTMRQRLRELTYDSSDKRGIKRKELDVQTCFAPLLSWILSLFRGKQRQVVIALDATTLRNRFVILSVSVLVCGTAIPVAWHIQAFDRKGKWNPIWQRLVTLLLPAIPTNWTVYALTDSGLYAKSLYDYLTQTCGWHVFMRTDVSDGLFKPKDTNSWCRIDKWLAHGMTPRTMTGTCFKSNPIDCTLILLWHADCQTPCLLISDLAPSEIKHNIYSLRYWIECGFKDIKRGLFHWEHTKMPCPRRAERLWLVLSIALLWVTAIGQQALDDPQWACLRGTDTQARRLSAPRLGWIVRLIALCQQQPIPLGYLNPYRWHSIPEP